MYIDPEATQPAIENAPTEPGRVTGPTVRCMPKLSMMGVSEAAPEPPPPPGGYELVLETPEQQAIHLEAMAAAGEQAQPQEKQQTKQEATQDRKIPWQTIGLSAGGGIALILCIIWFANMKDELKHLGWGLLALAVICLAAAALPTQGHEGPATA